MHVKFFHRPAVKFIKSLTGRTHVNIKYRHVNLGIFFPDVHGLFGIVHTANLGAIGLAPAAGIPGTHTGNNDYRLRFLPGRRADQMAFRRTGGIGEPFKFQGRDHIRGILVTIFAKFIQRQQFKTGSRHDGAIMLGNNLILLGIVDTFGRTNLRADTAFSGLEFQAVLPVDNRHLG